MKLEVVAKGQGEDKALLYIQRCLGCETYTRHQVCLNWTLLAQEATSKLWSPNQQTETNEESNRLPIWLEKVSLPPLAKIKVFLKVHLLHLHL